MIRPNLDEVSVKEIVAQDVNYMALLADEMR